MAEISSVKRDVGYWFDYNESLIECCYCHGSLRDPVMLKCLHNCCRACSESSASGTQTVKSSLSVKCPVCEDATERGAVMSNGLLYNYKRLSSLSSEVVNCMTCDDEDAEAVYWCADCCQGLCERCYSWHKRFHRRHRSAELEVARAWSLSQVTPAARCDTHKRQMEVQCFTCRGPKCFLCCASCISGMHDLEPLSHENSRNYVSKVTAAISANRERLSRAVSSFQQKYQDVRRHLHGARIKDGSRLLVQHKRSLHDATDNAFDMSVDQVCVNLERICCASTTGMVKSATLRETATLACRNFEMLLVERLDRLKLLRESHLLKKIVTVCTAQLRVLLRQRRKYWQENGAFSIDGSLPRTSDIVLRSCLGATDRRRAAAPAPLLFGQACVTFRPPVDCWDIAVTRDGHVLLAACEHGLLVYSDRGQQLSSWRPARQSDGEDDLVSCVAALSDGRAAVGVSYAQLVVLLRLSETGDTWLLDRRVVVLQSPPGCLAVHADLLAAAEHREDAQKQQQGCGQVKLLRLSSCQVLYTQTREYDIGRVAITGLYLVTTSFDRVRRNNGAMPCVVEVCSHSGDFLWRYETSDKEGVLGLCVSSETWSRVYIAVLRRDGSSRVMAIGGADGRDRRDVLSSSTHGLQLPLHLSLARQQRRTVMAVLSYDRAVDQRRTVSVYEAISDSSKNLVSTSSSQVGVVGSECSKGYLHTAEELCVSEVMTVIAPELSRLLNKLKGFAYYFTHDFTLKVYYSTENDDGSSLKSDLEQLLRRHIPAHLVKVTVEKSLPEMDLCCGGVGSTLTVDRRQQHVGLYLTYEGSETIYWLSSAHGWLLASRAGPPNDREPDHCLREGESAEPHISKDTPLLRSRFATCMDIPEMDVTKVYLAYDYTGPVITNSKDKLIGDRQGLLPSSTDSKQQLRMAHSVDVMIGGIPFTRWHAQLSVPYKPCLISAVKGCNLPVCLKNSDGHGFAEELYKISSLVRFNVIVEEGLAWFKMDELLGTELLCYFGGAGNLVKGKVTSTSYNSAMKLPGASKLFTAQNMILIQSTDERFEAAAGHSGSVWVRSTEVRTKCEAVAVTCATYREKKGEPLMWLAAPLCACLLALSEQHPQIFCDFSKFDVVK